MANPELKPWQQLLADRALGVERDPEERGQLLGEARQAARPPAPGWAEKAAGRAVEQRQPAQPGRTFAEALRDRLTTSRGAEDNDPDTTPPAA